MPDEGERTVYLDDRHAPPLRQSWAWVKTVKDFQEQMAAGDVRNVSLDYHLGRSDPGRTGADAARWMLDTSAWPSQALLIHSGSSGGLEAIACVAEESGLFEPAERHVLGLLCRRSAS